MTPEPSIHSLATPTLFANIPCTPTPSVQLSPSVKDTSSAWTMLPSTGSTLDQKLADTSTASEPVKKKSKSQRKHSNPRNKEYRAEKQQRKRARQKGDALKIHIQRSLCERKRDVMHVQTILDLTNTTRAKGSWVGKCLQDPPQEVLTVEDAVKIGLKLVCVQEK